MNLKQKIKMMCRSKWWMIIGLFICLMMIPQNVWAASEEYLDKNGVHVYRDTPGDVESAKYDVKVNGTDVKAIKYEQNGNNFDIARFATGTMSPTITVTVSTEEINTVKVYPERYYSEDSLQISEDKHTVTFQMSEESNLRYAFVMINGGPEDQKGKPYLALINDPEETVPDLSGDNVLNFKEFSEQYLAEHPNSEAQTAEEAGVTSGGISYEAGELVDNSTSQVRFPDKRKMLENDVTYALQAALDEIYKEGSPYDTLYFPDGTYICSGLEIRNRNGKHVEIYIDEGALVKNRLQECMQAMEPAIGIWDSSDITISGRGMFDGSGVANYNKDRHDAKDSCHQGGVMITRSSNIVFNDTYVRDAKQWNWESHGSKNCTLNNIKGLTPYNQPWIDGLDMASAQNLTVNGALTLGNDDNFASGHYNPSDGFTNTVPGYDQYNSDCLEWDTEDSTNILIQNTLGWSYSGGNGIRMGHNTYGHQMKDYVFDNVNTTNFQGGGRGITIQNSTGTYPRYESIIIKNSSFDTTRVGTNMDINGKADNMIETVTVENCWFSNADDQSYLNNITNLTIKDLYMGGEKVTVSNFAKVTTNNVTNFVYDWEDNQMPEFTAPAETTYNVKVGEEISIIVVATDADEEEVTLTTEDFPEGAVFDKETGEFKWTPSEDQLGTVKVTFTATDAKGAQVTKELTFNINDKVGNTAPVFNALEGAPYTVKVGDTLTFTVVVTDFDGDTVTLSVEELPRGAAFDAESGVFTWTPVASQTGGKELVFTAVDQWGASSEISVQITVDAGLYKIVEISAIEDSYMAAWKNEKNNNYAGLNYLRVRRMKEAVTDTETYGIFGENITSVSDSKDAKVSLVKFDAAQIKENLENLEKAELELTLINRRESSSTGNDRLMVVAVTGEWNESSVTWNTYPTWNIENIKYSEEFLVDKNSEVKNNVDITSSSYDGTKVTVDITEFLKNLTDEDTVLSLAVCDENGYELAFASTEGAASLEDETVAPVLRLSVKKEIGQEVESGRIAVLEDTFVGSWSGDQSKNYGTLNFLRTSYSTGSTGVLGTESGSDNKITYLKFDISTIDLTQVDRVKLQMALLGVRYSDAKNLDAQILVGVTEDNSWSETSMTWKNKPSVTITENSLSSSETFNLGEVVHNDPAQISTPNGTIATVDVTEFVVAAKESGATTLTLVVNIDGSNGIDKANRIYFVSKEGSQAYENAADMIPSLVLTTYEDAQEHTHDLVKVEGKEATCTEPGTTAHYKCSGCDKLFVDENGEEEITEESIVIEVKGHAWDEGKVTEEATVEKEGVKTYTCLNCQETKTESIPKLEPSENPEEHTHNLVKVEGKEATCTESGTTAHYKCSGCDKLFADENGEEEITEESTVIEAKGHAWDEGKVTEEATVEKEGVKTYTCLNCQEIKTESIPKLEPSENPDVDPTPGEDPDVDPTPGEDPDVEPTPGEDSDVDPTPGENADKDATPDESSKDNQTTVPTQITDVKTMDSSYVVLWMGIMLAAMGTIGCTIFYRKKKF